MKKINEDNIDEIMFSLLEGDITGTERKQLLDAIEADPEYSKIWALWKNTIAVSPEVNFSNPSKLYKKEERKESLCLLE